MQNSHRRERCVVTQNECKSTVPGPRSLAPFPVTTLSSLQKQAHYIPHQYNPLTFYPSHFPPLLPSHRPSPHSPILILLSFPHMCTSRPHSRPPLPQPAPPWQLLDQDPTSPASPAQRNRTPATSSQSRHTLGSCRTGSRRYERTHVCASEPAVRYFTTWRERGRGRGSVNRVAEQRRCTGDAETEG